jgi:peptidoglycan/xylan/chitin deacetylase (PgdA/CDA1 family)
MSPEHSTSKVLVLCYHAVSEQWDAPLSVTPDDLRRQLGGLVARGWRGATFTDALSAPHRRTLAVTFDDAFDSVRTLAAPVLADLGLPATVFVATDWVDQPLHWPEVARWASTVHAGELRSMSWDSLGDLAASGWEIGSHTCSHPHLSQLDSEAIDSELRRSRAAVLERGIACRSVAYPFGDADERVRAAAVDVGYEAAAGLSSEAFVARNRYEWPRVGVWHGEPDWRFELKVRPLTAHLRGTRWASFADVARKRVRSKALPAQTIERTRCGDIC